MQSYGVAWTSSRSQSPYGAKWFATDSSGAPPKCLLVRGRRGPVKGVSPGGAPFARPARLPEARGRGVDTPKGRPGGVLWTLDGVPPPTTLVLGGAPEGRGGGLWVL